MRHTHPALAKNVPERHGYTPEEAENHLDLEGLTLPLWRVNMPFLYQIKRQDKAHSYELPTDVLVWSVMRNASSRPEVGFGTENTLKYFAF